MVRAAASRLCQEWISGRGWDQNLWSERRFPGKATLDRAAPRHPVALVRIDGHATWANSAALHEAGISRDTADPTGGSSQDGRGQPTDPDRPGPDIIRGLIPAPSEERFDQAVRDTIAGVPRQGLTARRSGSTCRPSRRTRG
jgi:predicted amidohydrolase YtcJ